MTDQRISIPLYQEQNYNWHANAYPLHRLVVCAQGTRHANREELIQKLEEVIKRVRAGDMCVCDHDDDAGFYFEYRTDVTEGTVFAEPSGRK